MATPDAGEDSEIKWLMLLMGMWHGIMTLEDCWAASYPIKQVTTIKSNNCISKNYS